MKRFISLLKRLFMRLCKFCGSDISQLNPKAKYCSPACRLKDYRNGKPIPFGPDKIHETPLLKINDQPLSQLPESKGVISGNSISFPGAAINLEKHPTLPEIVNKASDVIAGVSDIEFFINKTGIKYRLSRELLLDLLERFPDPSKKLQYVSADNSPMPDLFSISHLREPEYYQKPINSMDDYFQRVGTAIIDPMTEAGNKMITDGIRYNTISDYQKQYEDLVVSNGTSIEFQQLADDIKSNPLLTQKQITILLHQINCIK